MVQHRWNRSTKSTRTRKNSAAALSRLRSVLLLEALERRDLPSGLPTTYLINASVSDASGPVGYTPQQIETAYGIDDISYTGAGQTIVLVDAYNNPDLFRNLQTFDVEFGLPNPPMFREVNKSGGSTLPMNALSGSQSWGLEEALDVEWAHAIAPQACIVLVEADDGYATSTGLASLMQAAGTAGGLGDVVSMSFGYNESIPGSGGEATYDMNFTDPGVTYLASSGDSGAPPLYPSTSPNVVAVGGTTLQLNPEQSEAGWTGSGGGFSMYENLPTYQSGVTIYNGSGTEPNPGNNRATPDVAYDADPSTGFAVYDTYQQAGWVDVGGTSAGTPQWAGLIALADQGRVEAGRGTLAGSTQTLPTLYTIPQDENYNEITSGTSMGSPNYSVGMGVGYNYNLVTGLGSPMAQTIVPALVSTTIGTPSTASTTTLGSSASSSSVLSAVTFTATVTGTGGTPTGTVTFEDGGVSIGSGTLATGTATFSTSMLSVGTHSITAFYDGDANFSASRSSDVTQTVTGLTAPQTLIVTTTADSGAGSLREAIEESNLITGGTNTIEFEIGAGTQTITLDSALPAITNPVVVDATRLSGFSTQNIVIDGGGASGFDNGFDIEAGGSTIAGDDHLAIEDFGSGAGIFLYGASGNLVTGTFVGTNWNDDSGLGDLYGIEVDNSASNTIGGTAAGAENVISGNSADGVVVGGSLSASNIVEADVIGTNSAGTSALANGGDGVVIEGGATGNEIGTITNLISGNTGDGVYITGAGTDDNVVLGNDIGTDALGTAAVANGGAGVRIDMGASGNTIGATSGSAINLISGNTLSGLIIGASITDFVDSATGNLVDSSVIGLAGNGTSEVPNGGDGILIQGGAFENSVGLAAGHTYNIISANRDNGVEIDGDGGYGIVNSVASSGIGCDSSGDTIAVGNAMAGVLVDHRADGTAIGGTGGGASNLISGNLNSGLVIDDSLGCTVAGNAIGTDVSGSLALANTNGGVILRAGANSNTIGGSGDVINLISGNNGLGILINDSSSCQVAGNAIGTDVSGSVALGNLGGVEIDAGSASDIIGSTGAFNIISGNTGSGVLIEDSSSCQVLRSVIGLDMSGEDPLPNTEDGVTLDDAAGNLIGSAIPNVTNLISANTGNGITIMGSLSTGNQIINNVIGADVTATEAEGNANGVVIKGGATANSVGWDINIINIISGNVGDGILIQSDGNLVQGNAVGTDVTGAGALPNGSSGVEIAGNNNTVGATVGGGVGENIIAFNTLSGVVVDSSYYGDLILSNSIYANSGGGISLQSGANNGIMPPTLSSASSTSNSLLVTIPAGTYTVEFFSNGMSGTQGETFLGYATAVSGPNTVTFGPFSPALYHNEVITATLTDTSGDTSEFSSPVTVS